MSSKLLQLSLYVVTVIQLTSSEYTHDGNEQENGVKSCGSTDEMLIKLMMAVSESLTHDVNSRERSDRMFNQLMSAASESAVDSREHSEQILSQLMTALSQLKLSNVNSSSCESIDHVLNQLMTTE